MDNGTTPITGLADLEAHLDALLADPALLADAKLFDHVELQLTDANIPPLLPTLLPRISQVLKQYAAGDPKPVADLAVKLIGAAPVALRHVLSIASEAELIQALSPAAPPSANLLALAVCHKAAQGGRDDAALLSSMPDLVAALVQRWLAAPQVEVGERAGHVLGDLLDVDCPLAPPPPPAPLTNGDAGGLAHSQQQQLVVLRRTPGHGAMWRRVLRDPQVYDLIPSICTGRHPEVSSSPHQTTLAQGRLLRVLPRLAALDLAAVTTGDDHSLLRFAALHMVDRTDVLMHLSLVDFFETLVSVLRVAAAADGRVQAKETLRALLREALQDDETLKEALSTLPDRTVPEEADALRAWLSEVMPGVAVRVGGWTG